MTNIVSFGGGANGFNSESRFIEQALEDGIALLVEAKNYISYQEKRERESAALSTGLRIGYQQTRLTARIMHSLAWLLGHKAIAAGEILPEQLEAADWKLGGGADCITTYGETSENLPKGLRDMLARSHAFYARVARLETMMQAVDKVQAPKRYDAKPTFMGLRLVSSDVSDTAMRA